MNKGQFKKAFKLAISDTELPPYLGYEVSGAISGCALDNKRRYVTLDIVASVIRGHCVTFTGALDLSELTEIETLSKRFDLIERK